MRLRPARSNYNHDRPLLGAIRFLVTSGVITEDDLHGVLLEAVDGVLVLGMGSALTAAVDLLENLALKNRFDLFANVILRFRLQRTSKRTLRTRWPRRHAPLRESLQGHVTVTNHGTREARGDESPAFAGKAAEVLQYEVKMTVLHPLGTHAKLVCRSRGHLLERETFFRESDHLVDACGVVGLHHKVPSIRHSGRQSCVLVLPGVDS